MSEEDSPFGLPVTIRAGAWEGDEVLVPWSVGSLLAEEARAAARRVEADLQDLWRKRVVRLLTPPLLAAGAALAALVHETHFDRTGLPDLSGFIRFEPPTIGAVYDSRGERLLELAHEYRRIVSYREIPRTVRDAVLAAEDKAFFSHHGVDWTALPRVVAKAAWHTGLASWRASREGRGLRLVLSLPQGGSTLTQQLVRGYFLGDMKRRESQEDLVARGLPMRLAGAWLGAPTANKLARKIEEVRLSLWLEEALVAHYGSRERAKQEIFARYVSFVYVGHGRYGLAAGSEYYFGQPLGTLSAADAHKAAMLAGITKSPRLYAPSAGNLDRPSCPAQRGPPPHGAQREPLPGVGRAVAVAAALDRGSPGREDGGARRHRARVRGAARRQRLAPERGTARARSDPRPLHRPRRHPEDRQRGARAGPRGLREAAPRQRGTRAGLRGRAGERRRARPRRDGRPPGLPGPAGLLHRPQPRHRLAPAAGLGDEAPRLPRRLPEGRDPRQHRARFSAARFHGRDRPAKSIRNYDGAFKGPIAARQALAESRNAATVWLARTVGMPSVLRTARSLGIRTPLQPYVSTALGSSDVQLLELANAYRSIASGSLAEPQVIDRVTTSRGEVIYRRQPRVAPLDVDPAVLLEVQEGLRGVIRLPGGTAHSLSSLPYAVMGKTGTTSEFKDALFVGSTFGGEGITVAVRIGFDDNRALGPGETGGRTALPVFREIVTRLYEAGLVPRAPRFPKRLEDGITRYLALAPAPPLPDAAVSAPGPVPAAATVALVSGGNR